MKVLQVIDQAFRTVVEEQDDTILWLTQSMRGAGAELVLLLRGHAVHYAVQSRRQPALTVGEWRQSEPAELHLDIQRLIQSGVHVHAVREEMDTRGLTEKTLQPGISIIDAAHVVDLYENADQVWQW